MKETTIGNTIQAYYLINVLKRLGEGFFFATYVIFLMASGLDLFQVTIVNLTFMATIFLFEIPTGAFADSLGRKNSVIIGLFLFGAGMFIYFFSNLFILFIIAEFVAGIGACFISGAFDAWLVDNLKSQKFKGNFVDIFSKGGVYSEPMSIFSALIGGYLGTINLALPWLAAGVTTMLAAVLAILMMKEPYFKPKPFRIRSTFDEMKKIAEYSVKYGLKHPVIFNMIAAGFLLGFATQPWNMFWSPFFKDLLNTDTAVLGWIWVGISASMVIGMYFAKQTLAKLKQRNYVLIFDTILISLAIILSALVGMPYLAIIFFFTHEIGRGMWKPIDSALMNDYIPSKQRATIISFDSMITRGGAALGLLMGGFLAKEFGISNSWIFTAVALLASIYFFLRIDERNKK